MRSGSEEKEGQRTRTRYSPEYKGEALKLAESVGTAEAAERLGLSAALRYSWKSRSRLEEGRSEAKTRLLAENARLKRRMAEQAEELAILKKTAAYFAKGLR